MTFAILHTTNVIKIIKNPPWVIRSCPLLLHYHYSVGQGLHNAHAQCPAEVQFRMRAPEEQLQLRIRFTDLGGCRLQVDLLNDVLFHEREDLRLVGTHYRKNVTIWKEEQVVIRGVYRFQQEWQGAYVPDDAISYDLIVTSSKLLPYLVRMIGERLYGERVRHF